MGDLSLSNFSDNEQDWQTVSLNPVKRVRSPGHATSPLSKKYTSIFTSANRFSLLAPPEEDTQLVMEVTEQPDTNRTTADIYHNHSSKPAAYIHRIGAKFH